MIHYSEEQVKSVEREDDPVPEVKIAEAVNQDNLKEKYLYIFKKAPVSHEEWKDMKRDTDKMNEWKEEVQCTNSFPAFLTNLKKHTVKLQCLLDKVYKIPQEEEKDEEVHIETRQDKVADDGHAKIADDGHAKINQDSISNTSDKLIFRSLFQKYKDLTGLEFEGSVVHQKESELIKKIMKNDEEIDEKWTR